MRRNVASGSRACAPARETRNQYARKRRSAPHDPPAVEETSADSPRHAHPRIRGPMLGCSQEPRGRATEPPRRKHPHGLVKIPLPSVPHGGTPPRPVESSPGWHSRPRCVRVWRSPGPRHCRAGRDPSGGHQGHRPRVYALPLCLTVESPRRPRPLPVRRLTAGVRAVGGVTSLGIEVRATLPADQHVPSFLRRQVSAGGHDPDATSRAVCHD